VLYGRDLEREYLAGLLKAAHSGMSSAIVVRGEAGAGKSSLLDDVAAHADGVTTLRAVGVESESELAFAGLHQLLAPVLLRNIDSLMPPRRAALRSALGLTAANDAPDRFLVAAAVLDLLAAAAEHEPVLAIVDDAQWIDGASQDALLFVGRRLDLDGIVLMFGVRESEASRFDARGLETLTLSGLDDVAAVALIGRRTGIAPVAGVVSRLVAETGGNPLALGEIAASVDEAVLRGDEPLPDPLPLSRGIEAAFSDRMSRLPDATRAMLLVAALEPRADLPLVARAGAVIGAHIDDLEPAELAGVVRVDGSRVVFDHPLLRSAVEAGATWAQRRRVHQALGQELPAADVDRRAWHAAAAALDPDEAVAAELERLAQRARGRGGNASAQAAFTRAAELSTDPADSGRRLLAAADAAWHAGRAPEAVALLDRAESVVSDDERVRADHLRGVIALRTGAFADAHRLLIAAATHAAAVDLDRAVRILGDAARTGAFAGNPAWIADAAAALRELPDPPSDGTRLIRTMVGAVGAILLGDTALGTARLREALPLAEQAHDVEVSSYAITAAYLIGDVALATRLLASAEAAARELGVIGDLPQLLILRAAAENDAGRFGLALAAADEGATLARASGQRAPYAACRAHMACAAAVRGETELAREAAAEATAIATELGISLVLAVAAYGAALTEISLGRDEAALTMLGAIEHPIFQPQRAAEECEAMVRIGRQDDAGSPLERLERIAVVSGIPVNEARLERCRGLLAGESCEVHFARALELHGDSRPYERARTELAYGEALRRARRRVDARVPLRRALDAFERMGAEPWAARADRELRATGGTSRRRDASTIDQLTPQELAICRLVAEGLSNREIAARLFLSARTIEYHLHKVFPKLGITSRVELARLDLGGEQPAPIPA
jgi:DNA-binding CsgD family transcriptional regulator